MSRSEDDVYARSPNPLVDYDPAVMLQSVIVSRGAAAQGGLVKNELKGPFKVEAVHFRVRQLPAFADGDDSGITNWPSSLRWLLHAVDVSMKLNDKRITGGMTPVIAFCPRLDEVESHVWDEVAIWRPEPFIVDNKDDLYCSVQWASDSVPWNEAIAYDNLPTQLLVEVTFLGKSLPSGDPMLGGSRKIPYVAAYREIVRDLADTNLEPLYTRTPTAALQNAEEEPMVVTAMMGARVTAYSPWDAGANDFIRIFDSNGDLVTRDAVTMLELFGARREWACRTVLKPKEYFTIEWDLGRQSILTDEQTNDEGQIPGLRTFEATSVGGTLLSRYQHIFGIVGYRETNMLVRTYVPGTSRTVRT